MRRDPTDESAAARARWLAELVDVLQQAQDVAWRFGAVTEQGSEAMDLYARLEAVRGEVRSLQLRAVPSRNGQIDPNWMSSLPWDADRKSELD